MAYGLQTFNANGNLGVDTSKRYTRLVYSTITGSDGSVDLPEIDGKETTEWGFFIEECYAQPFVSRSGTTISWNIASDFSCNAMIVVFIHT